jgi:hypothetical protein
MSRLQNLAKIAKKKYGGRKVTEREAAGLLDIYPPGLKQQRGGGVLVLTLDRFLAQMPETNRDSFESGVQELFRYSNFKRFRNRALTLLMTAYQNGSVDGSNSGKPFDLQGMIEAVAAEVQVKYSILET